MRVSVTTPAGVAKYCWLTKPDTAFNSENWKVTLVLSKDAAKPLISKIEKERKAHVAEEKAKNKKVKEAEPPFKPDMDEEGNPTGDMLFTFSSKTSVKPRIPLFDAKRKPMRKGVEVWNGSVIKVNGILFPYVAANGAGISLKLNAVQILELVSSGNGAGGYGFEEEDGYEEEEEDTFEDEENIDKEGDF